MVRLDEKRLVKFRNLTPFNFCDSHGAFAVANRTRSANGRKRLEIILDKRQNIIKIAILKKLTVLPSGLDF
jgi:hypothetical protein